MIISYEKQFKELADRMASEPITERALERRVLRHLWTVDEDTDKVARASRERTNPNADERSARKDSSGQQVLVCTAGAAIVRLTTKSSGATSRRPDMGRRAKRRAFAGLFIGRSVMLHAPIRAHNAPIPAYACLADLSLT
jgi:hypothetical protein